MNKYPDWGPAPIKNSGCNNITGIKHNVQPGITAPPHPPKTLHQLHTHAHELGIRLGWLSANSLVPRSPKVGSAWCVNQD